LKPDAVRVVRNLAWLGGGEVVLKGALFAAGVLVARALGPAAMGNFTVGYGASVVLMLVLNAGQIEVVIREVAQRPPEAVALYGAARGWQRRVALVALPLALGAALLVKQPALRWTLVAFLPYAWLRSSLVTAGAAFKGLDRMDVEVGGRAAELVMALVLLVPLALAKAPVWTTGIAFAIGAAVGVAVIKVRFPSLPDAGGASVTREFLAREGLAFLGLAITTQVLMRADTFLLASFGVAADQIGRYGVASAPVWGLLGLAQLLSLAIYPTMARAAAGGALRVHRVLMLGGAGVALGVALAFGLECVRSPLVRLVFGPAYGPAVPLLAVLAWALPPACGAMLLGAAIASCGRQGWSLYLRVLLVVFAVGGNVVAIPRWGLMGAAVVAVGVSGTTFLGAATIAALAVVYPPRAERAVFAEPGWE
jgi:O-antigen/teichoic acid export membrane protein